MVTIDCQRELFDIPEDVAYFNCAYMSPLPRRSVEAGERGLRRKTRPWEIRPPHFFDESERAREVFAQLIGAQPGDVAIVPSVSYGIDVAAANVAISRGDRIVVLEEQFPSNVYPWRRLAQARDAQIVTVARPEDYDWTPRVLDAMGPASAVVALPAVHWTDGSRIDLVAVGRRCREIGAQLVLDITQSLGAAPFAVSDIQPDWLACATYKWLLGPYSLGFLYASPAAQDRAPIENGWIAREGSQDFAGLVRYRDEFDSGARRYDVGERANFALLPAAITSLEQIDEWGVDGIAASLESVTDRIASEVARLDLVPVPRERREAHLMGVRFPSGLPDGLVERFAERRVYVSIRGDSVRIAPHLFNNERDVDRLLEVLADFAP